MADIFLYPGEANPNDVRLRDPTTGGGSTIPLNLSDTITLSDSTALTTTISKADTVMLSDAVVKSVSLSKSDSITLSEAIVKAIGKVQFDSVILSEAISRVMGLNKSDSLALSDLLVKGININESDAIVLSDSISILKPLLLALSDTITLSDLASTLLIPTSPQTPQLGSGGGSTGLKKDVSLKDYLKELQQAEDEEIVMFIKAFLHILYK